MSPFAQLERTPVEHFKLHCYQAVLHLRELVPGADEDLAFLRSYYEEIDATGLDRDAWARELAEWEQGAEETLPLVALAEAAGFERGALVLLFVAGLIDEDARFGDLYEALNGVGGVRRPTAALLHGWLAPAAAGARRSLRRLVELGLLELDEQETLRVPPLLWAAMRGEVPAAPWLRHQAAADARPAGDLILPERLKRAIERVPDAIAASGAVAVLVRGPARSGRRTVLGTIARELGRGVLEIVAADEARWRLVGPLATLAGAMPVTELDVGPGDLADLPLLDGYTGPLGVAIGRQGGVGGATADGAIVLDVELPAAAEREEHWRAALGPQAPVSHLAASRRMTGGNIRRAAALARTEAALAGRDQVADEDVRAALRTLHGRLLDTLAARVDDDADWSLLAAPEDTLRELELLESRCRHRERLRDEVGPAFGGRLTPGVRALLSGPSGTGKTLAARILAASLGVDLYRIDLSRVVNKYLGETEKNLSAIFARAEEADIALLLDEGDSLLTQRTSVQNANDRWANLETNYLLQRLESFEGVLLVTTNAGERIDSAFRRRMDVVIEFRAPDPAERWGIWRLHLPEANAVDDALLNEIAVRCALTGGQIRNAVLHASLLALEDARPLGDEHVGAALAREYRKAGQVCPLPMEALTHA